MRPTTLTNTPSRHQRTNGDRNCVVQSACLLPWCCKYDDDDAAAAAAAADDNDDDDK